MTTSGFTKTLADNSPITPTYEHDKEGGSSPNEAEIRPQYEGKTPSQGSNALEQVVISWEPNDPENPYNWSNAKKTSILTIAGMLVLNSTMGSSLPSQAIPDIIRDFEVVSQTQRVLPITVYLIGYVFGPIIWGPLSEHLGRRNLSIFTFVIFTIFTLACAVAPNWGSFLFFRLVSGVCASSPIAIVAGVIADIYDEPRTRGRALAVFMVATVFGPLFAPIIVGFVTPALGWRWSFWIALIYAGLTLILSLFLPETFGPILLARRAKKLRQQQSPQQQQQQSIVAPRDLEPVNLSQLFGVVLTRPLRMLAFELIVSSTCAYLSLVYSIFYMSFQAFPIIFQTLYGLSPGVTGLTYLPIGLGATLSIPIFWFWDNFLHKAEARGASWAKREEYRRLPLACLGGPLFVISLFWLGFTARTSVSFVVPMLAGIPFGMGYLLLFMALLNYLTDAYEIFAASANAAASTSRSLFAVVLPLATAPMFKNLGISGACALLASLSAVMCIIPFIFIWKGPAIRSRSQFCIALRERKEEMHRKVEEGRQRNLQMTAMMEKEAEAV